MIRAVPLVLGLLLLALPLAAGGPASEPAAGPAGLPPGVAPLPADFSQRLEELMAAAEKYRGLKAKQPVPSGVIEEAALRGKVAEEVRKELPSEELKAVAAGLKAFGLIPEELDLVRWYPELLTTQVAGYYDPDRKYLSVVYRDGSLLGKLGKSAGAEEGPLEEMVLVHELTHALQDQHFDLGRFVKADLLSDANAARLALVEGDAALTMFDFYMGVPLETVPGVEKSLGSLAEDSEKLLAAGPNLPGTRELAGAPAWFRDTLLFSYLEGYEFCLSVRKKGGQALLDHAFRQDPPLSSEQILHPEKWHSRRDDPVALTWPDLSGRLPGFRKVVEGELGELGIKILLREAGKDKAADAATAADTAAGWGGDRFAVYEKEGRRVLAWITEWDSEADAKELLAAVKALGADWRAELTSPRRVVVLRGAKGQEPAGLRAELAAAAARRPENRDLDLAALGAAPSGAAPDPAALLESPAVQQQIQAMLREEKPAGQVSEDGRAYTNADLGFSLALPPSRRSWSLDAAPPVPMASLLVSSPDGEARIVIAHQAFPVAASIEDMKPLIELGLKAGMPGYASLGGGPLGQPGAWEERFEAAPDGRKVRGLLRLYARGESLILVTAVAPAERWEVHEPALREILGGFALADLK